MVVKFATPTTRGAAGESAMGQKKGYNFSNLYSINRSDDAKKAANKIGEGLLGTQAAVDRLGQQGSEAAGRGQDPAQYAQGIAAQVDKARGLADSANKFNPAVDAMKAGQSPYQAGLTSFYGGGKQAGETARKFAGIYDQVRATGNRITGQLPGMFEAGKAAVARQQALEETQKAAIAAGQRENNIQNYDRLQANIDEGNRNQPIRRIDNLDWMHKTGRITAEQRNRAMGDRAYYDQLMKEFS